MDDLLTTRQVLELLKVDRITIYRMLQDGRLNGVKIGQQWRFYRRDVDRLLGNTPAPAEPAPMDPRAVFPTHCVQTIQDLYSDVSGVSSLVVDTQGELLTELTHPNSFCRLVLQSPAGRAACQASWRQAAARANGSSQRFSCHAGLEYVAAPVRDENSALVGHFISGEFQCQALDAQEEESRIRHLAAEYQLDPEALRQAAAEIPIMTPTQCEQMEKWPLSAARAIQSILHERTGFMNRLQQIANLSQI